MRYVAAYLLAVLGGQEKPSAKDIKKILESVGVEAEQANIDKVVKELSGKSVSEVISQGLSKLASVPSGGGAPAAAAAPAAGKGGAAAAAAPAAAAPAKKEEKKEESEEEEGDMGFGLFD